MLSKRIIKAGAGPAKAELFGFPTVEEYVSFGRTFKFATRRLNLFADPEQEEEEIGLEPGDVTGKARREAEKARKQASEEGFAEGLKRAETEASAELGKLRVGYSEGVEAVTALRQKILKESEGEIVALSLDIARKIIGAELGADPATVAKVIRTALERVAGAQATSVRLHPEDYAYFESNAPDFLAKAELISDPQVARGGAIIDTSGGKLDAQIEEQLAEIEKSLKSGMVAAAGVE